jgi:WD40 repeat protein
VIAAEIGAWLTSRGFENVFLDIDKHGGLQPGVRWEHELYRKIDSSQAMLLLITANWHDSKWCFAEYTQGRALGKAIFPIIVGPGGEHYIAPDIQQLDLLQDREGGLERLSAELTKLALDSQSGFDWKPGRPPFPGMFSFEKDDAAAFFGRDDDIRSLIERLNARRVRGDARIVAVLGASGSGKSSMVRAGVLPRLGRYKDNWILLPPCRPRRDPFGELARAACEALGTPNAWPDWVAAFAGAEASAEIAKLESQLRVRQGAREASLLITIDQSEELFAPAASKQLDAFFALLAQIAAGDTSTIVLFVLRSDYLGKFQEKTKSLKVENFSLGPFPKERIRQIIEGPAHLAGITFQDDLVDRAVADTGGSDALPLLAFMLRELYDRLRVRQASGAGDDELTLSDYLSFGDNSSETNPLECVVRKRADEVVDGLKLSPGGLGALQDAFVGYLARINDDGQYVRKLALFSELPSEAQPVIDALADARLIVKGDGDKGATAEVAHEALLRKWDRLRKWLDAEKEFVVGKVQLRYALADWTRPDGTRNLGALLSSLPLARAREWLKLKPKALTEDERLFIKASALHADLRRGLSWGAGGLALALILSLGILWIKQRLDAAGDQLAYALTIQSREALQTDPVKAAFLAAQSLESRPSVANRSLMLESVVRVSPHLVKRRREAELRPAAVAWSPDAKEILAGGAALVRWQPLAASPVAPRTLNISESNGNAVAVAWRQGTIVAVTLAGMVRKIDTATDRQTSVQLFDDRVDRVAIGAAGRILVSRFSETDLRVFDCAAALSGRQTSCASQTVGSQRVTALDFNDQKSIVAFAGEDGRVQAVSFGRSPFRKEIKITEGERVVAIALNGEADRLAIGTQSGRVVIADLESDMNFESPRQVQSISSMAWASTGLLATTCDSNAICIWNARQDSPANISVAAASTSPLSLLNGHSRLKGHTGIVRSIAFSPDGTSVASVSDDDTIQLWSVAVADQTSVAIDLTGGAAPADIALSADEKWLAAADDGAAIHIMDMASWESRTLLKAPLGAIQAMAWSPSTATFAAGDKAGKIMVQAWPDDGKRASFSAAAAVSALRWLRDGKAIVTAGSVNGNIEVHAVDGASAPGFTGGHPDSVNGLAVSPDGKVLLSSDADGNVVHWNIADRKAFSDDIRKVPPSRDTVVFNRAGNRYLVAGTGGEVVVLDFDGNKPPIRCTAASQQLDAADFVVGDTTVAAISNDPVPILYVWTLSAACDLFVSIPLVFGENESRPTQVNRRRLVVFDQGRAVIVTAASGAVALIKLDPSLWRKRAIGLDANAGI